MILRIPEKFLILASFLFILNEGNRDLPKGVDSESRKPLVGPSQLNQVRAGESTDERSCFAFLLG